MKQKLSGGDEESLVGDSHDPAPLMPSGSPRLPLAMRLRREWKSKGGRLSHVRGCTVGLRSDDARSDESFKEVTRRGVVILCTGRQSAARSSWLRSEQEPRIGRILRLMSFSLTAPERRRQDSSDVQERVTGPKWAREIYIEAFEAGLGGR